MGTNRLTDGETTTAQGKKDNMTVGPQHEVNHGVSEENHHRTLVLREKNATGKKTNSPTSSSFPPQIQISRDIPKLTLSAFRKPEFAVRLTSSPPNKLLHQDYDLTSS